MKIFGDSFNDLFDLDGDGKKDSIETAYEYSIFKNLVNSIDNDNKINNGLYDYDDDCDDDF